MTTSARRRFSNSNIGGSHIVQAPHPVIALFLCAAAVAAAAFGPGAAGQRVGTQFPVFIQTKPVTSGVLFDVGRHRIRSDRNGLALIPLTRPGVYELGMPSPQQPRPGLRVSFAAWSTGSTRPSNRVAVRTFTYRTVGLNVRRLTSFRFVDEQGSELEPEWIESLTLIDDSGKSHVFRGAGPHWLETTRVSRTGPGLQLEDISYSVHSVVVGGVNVASNPGATFRPGGGDPRVIGVSTLEAQPSPSPGATEGGEVSEEGEPLTIIVRDAFFGFPIGTAVRVRYPDGRSRRFRLQEGARLPLGRVPPGEYVLSAEGPGISLATRPDPNSPEVRLVLLSYLDIAVLLFVAAMGAAAVMALRTRRRGKGLRVETESSTAFPEPAAPPRRSPADRAPIPIRNPALVPREVRSAREPPPPPEPEPAPEPAPVAEPEPVARSQPVPERKRESPAPAPAHAVRPPAPPPQPERFDDPRIVRPRAESEVTIDEPEVVDLDPEPVPAPLAPSARPPTEPSVRSEPAATVPTRHTGPPPPSPPEVEPRPAAAADPDATAAEARSIIEDAEHHAREQRRLIARQRERLIDEMSRRRAQLEERERELTHEIENLEQTLGTLRSQLNVKIATSWLEREGDDEDEPPGP